MRIALATFLACTLLGAGVAAQERTPQPRRAGELWFDATQLPSFTGTVERYLLNPRGETDGLIFREGPQVNFPPNLGEQVRRAVAPGRTIIVWGIRARNAPVITMLAYAPSSDAAPALVDRVYWSLGGRQLREQPEAMQVSGTVKQPYYSPQGEVAGAVLEDGSVILLPIGAADAFRDLLRPGQRLAAEGSGQAAEDGRALLAERLGEAPGSLRPVVAPPQPR